MRDDMYTIVISNCYEHHRYERTYECQRHIKPTHNSECPNDRDDNYKKRKENTCPASER